MCAGIKCVHRPQTIWIIDIILFLDSNESCGLNIQEVCFGVSALCSNFDVQFLKSGQQQTVQDVSQFIYNQHLLMNTI